MPTPLRLTIILLSVSLVACGSGEPSDGNGGSVETHGFDEVLAEHRPKLRQVWIDPTGDNEEALRRLHAPQRLAVKHILAALRNDVDAFLGTVAIKDAEEDENSDFFSGPTPGEGELSENRWRRALGEWRSEVLNGAGPDAVRSIVITLPTSRRGMQENRADATAYLLVSREDGVRALMCEAHSIERKTPKADWTMVGPARITHSVQLPPGGSVGTEARGYAASGGGDGGSVETHGFARMLAEQHPDRGQYWIDPTTDHDMLRSLPPLERVVAKNLLAVLRNDVDAFLATVAIEGEHSLKSATYDKDEWRRAMRELRWEVLMGAGPAIVRSIVISLPAAVRTDDMDQGGAFGYLIVLRGDGMRALMWEALYLDRTPNGEWKMSYPAGITASIELPAGSE